MKNKNAQYKTTPQKIKSKVSKLLELPEYSISGMRIEITSNREAVVESCRGIIEYNTECVRLLTPGMIVRFSGKNLNIGCMAGSGAVVSGVIDSVDISELG